MRRYESNEEAKLRQQAEGNRKMEDVIVVYRKMQGADGRAFSRFVMRASERSPLTHPLTRRDPQLKVPGD